MTDKQWAFLVLFALIMGSIGGCNIGYMLGQEDLDDRNIHSVKSKLQEIQAGQTIYHCPKVLRRINE